MILAITKLKALTVKTSGSGINN